MKLDFLLRNKIFALTTTVPTVLSIIYFCFVASDVYVSESRFVVRSPDKQTTSSLGLILKGAGISNSQNDSYTVQDYILSRDALKLLNDELKIKDFYSSPSIDVFSRFSGIDFDNSLESFYIYYQKRINLQIDSASSISTLTVRGFAPEMVQHINQRLIELSEALVNQLNERARQDMIRFASDEVEVAQEKAKAAALALSQYRNAKEVIDPEKQSSIPLQQIAKLQDELLSTKAQVMQLEKVAKDNPQLPVLKQRSSLLESEINAEMKRVAGGERSLAGKAVEYQRFLLEKEFSDKMLASAMSSLEMAKNDALRKQLYLERIVQPNLPDEAMEPRRLKGVVSTFVVGLILFAVFTMLMAGMKEHLD